MATQQNAAISNHSTSQQQQQQQQQHRDHQLRHTVFVYGTLKLGQPNHATFTNEDDGRYEFLAEGTTVEKYPLVIGSKYNIPFLLDIKGKGRQVRGELYRVDEKKLTALDILEAHPSFYVRRLEPILVEIESGPRTDKDHEKNAIVEAWTYFLPTTNQELIDSEHLQCYSSKGPHNRPYVERSARLLDLQMQKVRYDLVKHMRGEADLLEQTDKGH